MTNAGARYFIHGFARARVKCPRSFSSDRTFCFGSSPADFGPASPRAIQSDCGEEGASRPRYSPLCAAASPLGTDSASPVDATPPPSAPTPLCPVTPVSRDAAEGVRLAFPPRP